MPEKISILKESGETVNSNVVSVFMIPDTQKKYLILTENTVDPHGLTVLHVSEILDGSLQKIATDEEWSSIKTIMRAIISGNVGSYQYLQTIDSIKANEIYCRDISVSASAAKQMSDNYAARDVNNIPSALDNKDESAIFPSGGNDVQADEVVPGIGVVDAPASPEPTPPPAAPAVEAAPVATPEPAPVAAPPVEPEPVPTPDPAPVAEVTPAPAPAVQEVAPTPEPVTAPAVVSEPAPVTVTEVASVKAPSPVPVSEPVNVPAAVEPVAVEEVVPTPVVVEPHLVAASPVTLPVSEPAVQTAPEPVTFVAQADLYAAQPAVTIPTGQIMQDAQVNSNLGIKFDANPSFSPNASLDEVVLASQEMFIEGVRNLVQTIQEKVYREMFNKEAELKAKEEMLNQREKMLNEQMMSMMSNFAAMQGKPASQVQPTKVETDSDKK